jgi:hypothetical protein
MISKKKDGGKAGHAMQKTETRKTRADLTAEEKERLEKFGSVEFKSAGATRKR